MPIDIQPLLVPISPDKPGGEDCRNGELYALLSAEVDLIGKPDATRPTDWDKVQQTALLILTTKAKDFMVASWYGVGLIETRGFEGIAASLTLWNGLFNTFWDKSFPPLTRIRGRRNAITWWLDHTTAWLDANPVPPLEKVDLDQLLSLANEFNQLFGERDQEAPSCSEFLRLIKAIDVIVVPALESDATVDSSSDGISSDADTENNPPVQDGVNSSVLNSGPNVVMKDLSRATSIDDVLKSLQPIQNYLGNMATVISALDDESLFPIQLNRFAARASLQELPANKGGLTQIPPPPQSELQMFANICSSDNPEGIAAFCEGRIVTYPFWFDLDHKAAEAYSALGGGGAKKGELIIDELLAFLNRLAGIETFSFSDKNFRFANSETLAWIADCKERRNGGGETDSFSLAKKLANESSGKGDITAAMLVFQQFIDNSRSLRDQFKSRLELISLLFNEKKESDILPFIQPLLTISNDVNLASWEPNLALQVWELQLRAIKRKLTLLDPNSPSDIKDAIQNLVDQALREISALNFVAATRQL
jgi:type VI secretion system protein VasJ